MGKCAHGASGIGELYLLEKGLGLLVGRIAQTSLMPANDLGQLRPAMKGGVEAGHGLLKDHGNETAPWHGMRVASR